MVRILLNFLTRTDFNNLRDQLTNTNRRIVDSNMLGGHVPTRQNWSAMWGRLTRALDRGAKMIVLDPRPNAHVKDAALWLHADALLVPDTEDFQDKEQGVVDMTTIPCRVKPGHEPE